MWRSSELSGVDGGEAKVRPASPFPPASRTAFSCHIRATQTHHRELALLLSRSLPAVLTVDHFVRVQVEVPKPPGRDGVVLHFGALFHVALLGGERRRKVTRRVRTAGLGRRFPTAEAASRARGLRHGATLKRGRHPHESTAGAPWSEAHGCGVVLRSAAVE